MSMSCIRCRGECRTRSRATHERLEDLRRIHGDMSHQLIAIHEGVSASRVQQIEEEALKKLRRRLEMMERDEAERMAGKRKTKSRKRRAA